MTDHNNLITFFRAIIHNLAQVVFAPPPPHWFTTHVCIEHGIGKKRTLSKTACSVGELLVTVYSAVMLALMLALIYINHWVTLVPARQMNVSIDVWVSQDSPPSNSLWWKWAESIRLITIRKGGSELSPSQFTVIEMSRVYQAKTTCKSESAALFWWYLLQNHYPIISSIPIGYFHTTGADTHTQHWFDSISGLRCVERFLT